jgi:hypothetical protein
MMRYNGRTPFWIRKIICRALVVYRQAWLRFLPSYWRLSPFYRWLCAGSWKGSLQCDWLPETLISGEEMRRRISKVVN